MVLLKMGQVLGQEPAAGKAIMNNWSYWRQYYVLMGPVVRGGGREGEADVGAKGGGAGGDETAMPPTGWTETEFNDGGEPQADYGPNMLIGLLCIRGRFNVDDPEKVQGTKLTVKYRGGVAVYLNGKEIARGNLKAGGGPRTWRMITRTRT